MSSFVPMNVHAQAYRTEDKHQMDALLGVRHHFPTKDNAVYIKEMLISKDMYVETHRHNYEHYSILGRGHVLVELDGERKEYRAPAVIAIKADCIHKIVALADSVWFCVHNTFEEDKENIDNVLIKGV